MPMHQPTQLMSLPFSHSNSLQTPCFSGIVGINSKCIILAQQSNSRWVRVLHLQGIFKKKNKKILFYSNFFFFFMTKKNSNKQRSRVKMVLQNFARKQELTPQKMYNVCGGIRTSVCVCLKLATQKFTVRVFVLLN